MIGDVYETRAPVEVRVKIEMCVGEAACLHEWLHDARGPLGTADTARDLLRILDRCVSEALKPGKDGS